MANILHFSSIDFLFCKTNISAMRPNKSVYERLFKGLKTNSEQVSFFFITLAKLMLTSIKLNVLTT